MKLSTRTQAILKNFVNWNPGIVLKPGKIIKTVRASGNTQAPKIPMDVLAVAEIEDTIEKQFAISDLSQFLAILSSFENPEITCKDKYLTITEGDRSVQYTYGEETFITTPPDQEIDLPKTLVEFKLPENDLVALTRINNVMGLDNVAVVGDKARLFLRGQDVKNPTNNVYNQKLNNGEGVVDFVMVFAADKFAHLMPMDYKVTVTKGVIRFVGKDVVYFMTPQEKYTHYAK